ncbi:hypothetical protein H4R20_004328 [Coemansia guatemalensis]|uniref:RRM domain-containing protein n=1 Tax=Coemansia guatemalensis TaxID=2761395 RepID=A0A9W8LQL5_9FUNG|nr:hypothetical protein H4R20_004328 [Coemansia guatemalensis]
MVADVANLLASKKICYVAFYDSRSARKAMLYLDKHLAIDRTVLILKESYHRPDAMGRPPKEDDYQGTVLISLTKTQHTLSNADRVHFEKYGDVCQFYPYHGQQNEWVVEYYDTRAAARAAFSCHGLPYLEGVMYTTFLWDKVADDDHQDVDSLDLHKPHIVDRDVERYSSHSQRAAHGGTAMNRKAHTQRRSEVVCDVKQPSDVDGMAPRRSYESTKAVVDDGPQAGICAENAINESTDVLANAGAASLSLDATAKSAPSPEFMQKIQDAKEILKQHQEVLGLGTPPSLVMEPRSLVPALSSEYQKATTSVEKAVKYELSDPSGPMNGQPLPDVALQSTPAAEPAPDLVEQLTPGDQSGKPDILQPLIEQPLSAPSSITMQSQPMQQYAQVHEQAYEPGSTGMSKSIYESEHSDGISRLLGILAQVQRPDHEGGPK